MNRAILKVYASNPMIRFPICSDGTPSGLSDNTSSEIEEALLKHGSCSTHFISTIVAIQLVISFLKLYFDSNTLIKDSVGFSEGYSDVQYVTSI